MLYATTAVMDSAQDITSLKDLPRLIMLKVDLNSTYNTGLDEFIESHLFTDSMYSELVNCFRYQAKAPTKIDKFCNSLLVNTKYLFNNTDYKKVFECIRGFCYNFYYEILEQNFYINGEFNYVFYDFVDGTFHLKRIDLFFLDLNDDIEKQYQHQNT